MQLQSDSCPVEPMAIDDLYIRIATVGNTIQTVNSPMYDTYMSTPGNTAKLGATHNIQTAQYNGAKLLNVSNFFLEKITWIVSSQAMEWSIQVT